MTDTTHPHPEPSEEASSLPVVGYVTGIAEGRTLFMPSAWLDKRNLVAIASHADAQSQLNAMRVERDAAFAMSRCECSPDEGCANIATLRAQLQEQALQYLSDNGQWIEETGRLRAELAALKASPVVDVERIMTLADEYARAIVDAVDSQASEIPELAEREALRASLVAHKAANVSDNGTCDQSMSHNVRAAATMAQTKEGQEP